MPKKVQSFDKAIYVERKLPRIKNILNADLFPKIPEYNSGKSDTVPDQSMSIREIFRRFASGQSVQGIKTPLYGEEAELSDIADMDFVDQQEQFEKYTDELKSFKKRKDGSAGDNKSDTGVAGASSESPTA